MKFEQWWRKKSFEMMARHDYGAEEIAAQPKWTLCKDGKKPDENQRVNAIIKSEIKKNPLYVDTNCLS